MIPPSSTCRLQEAQLFFNSEGKVQSIEIYIDDPDAVQATASSRCPMRSAGRDFLTDWQQRNTSFFTALQVERNVMFMILTLIVLVAALNIISGLIMLVKDKGRDIAILRTMGATRGAIMRVFLMTGAAIGVAGTIAGVMLGVVVVRNIREIQQFIAWHCRRADLGSDGALSCRTFPRAWTRSETVAVVIMALALSFLATLFPAWRAARLDPVEALRYE